MDRISPHSLTLDPEIQSRAQLDMVVIQEYADAMRGGAQFPPIKAIRENGTIYVYSGFHRTEAAKKAGVGLECEIKPGTFQDAQYLAAGENTEFDAQRRTNADKRRAVEHALIARAGNGNEEIARHCNVSSRMVGMIRAELVASLKISEIKQRTVTRNGKTYTQDTSNIGKAKEPEPDEAEQEELPFDEEQEPEDEQPPSVEPEPEPEPPQDTKSTSRPTFNRTNDNIEWAAWSWNPVTGCKHGCPYCYARDIANRFYKQGFEPTYHPDRLAAPMHTKPIPPRWVGDRGNTGVFVCSMADLFGEWVPDEWIRGVMDVVSATPEWTYIFLTKNPARLTEIDWPANSWVGTTIDTQARVEAAEAAFEHVNAPYKFVSCEPLRGPVEFSSLHLFDWVLIGGQSRSSQEEERQPLWDWVEDLLWQAREAQCKVYWKTNLTVRPREYPQ